MPRRRPWSARRAAAVAAAVAAAALAGSLPTRADETATFVGSDACRKCHAAEHERWKTSAHSLSVRPATAASMPADAARGATVEHAPGRTTFARAGAAFTATVPFDDGRAAATPVDYVVGLRRLTMLVTRLADGRHQVLPAMREEPGGVWFDYTSLLFGATGAADVQAAPVVKPGEPSFWTGPDRSFDARCARCHVSGYEPRPTPEGARGARSAWRALGIDCEECHGPASLHVAHWTNAPAGAPDPVARLAARPRDRSLDLCFACHLEGEPVGAPPRPGDDVLEHIEPTMLDNAVRVDPTGRPLELVYEGTSFLASTCAGAGKLRCLDCHDVHGSPNRSALVVAADRLNSLCARCHGEIATDPPTHTRHKASGSAGTCASCHMPLVTIERGHGAVHDHTMGTPRPAEGGRDACSWCHLGKRGAPADAPRIAAEALAAKFRELWPDAETRPPWRDAIAAGREGRADAGPALLRLARDPAAPRIVRASAAKLLGRAGPQAASELPFLASERDPLVRRGAVEGLAAVTGDDADKALLAALGDPSLAIRTAAARAALDGFARVQANERLLAAAIPVLEEDALAVPDDHLRWFRLGSARLIAGDDRGALAAFERKLQLDPGASAVRKTADEIRRRLAK